MNYDHIRALMTVELEATDALIRQQLSANAPVVGDMCTHIIGSGGKRIRPLVVLLSAAALNASKLTAVELAATIELIHTATLLHDDVVDTSDLRREKKTANAIWGNEFSVLVGDFLYSRAFQMIARWDNSKIIHALAKATNVIVEGEIFQLAYRKNPEVTLEQYMQVIENKTGALFEVSARLGALIEHDTEVYADAMSQYGLHLGIAFQLIDDALDFSGLSESIGKNNGDDLAKGSPTLPIIYAMHQSSAPIAAKIRQAITEPDRNHIEFLLKTIESTDAIAYTQRLAEEHAKTAAHHLEALPTSVYRDALQGLAQFAVFRTY